MHSRNSRFLLGSNSLTGREPFTPPPTCAELHFGLPASSRTPKRSSSVRSTPTVLICRLIYLVSQTKTVYARRVNESSRVLDVCSPGPANSLRLQTRGSDDGRRSQIPLIRSTMAENAATPFPSSVGETQPDLSELQERGGDWNTGPNKVFSLWGGRGADVTSLASSAVLSHTSSTLMRNKHLWLVQAAKVGQSRMDSECQRDISIPTINRHVGAGFKAPPVQTNLNLGDVSVIHQTGSVAWNRSSAWHHKLPCM